MSFPGHCYACGEWGHRMGDRECAGSATARVSNAEAKAKAAEEAQKAAEEAQKAAEEAKKAAEEAKKAAEEQLNSVRAELAMARQSVEAQRRVIDEGRDKLRHVVGTFLEMERVGIECADGTVYALRQVLCERSEFHAGLFESSSGSIRASRPPPREGELYGKEAVACLLHIVHAETLPFATDLAGLVDACELSAMWLIPTAIGLLAELLSGQLLDPGHAREWLRLRHMALQHFEVEGWPVVMHRAEEALLRILTDTSLEEGCVSEVAKELSLQEVCDLLPLDDEEADVCSHRALRAWLSVRGIQDAKAGACETLANLRAAAAGLPRVHVTVALTAQPDAVSLRLDKRPQGNGQLKELPLPNGSVGNAVVVATDQVRYAIWRGQESPERLDTSSLRYIINHADSSTERLELPCTTDDDGDTLMYHSLPAAFEGAKSYEELRWESLCDGHTRPRYPTCEQEVLDVVLCWATVANRSLRTVEELTSLVKFAYLPSKTILLLDEERPALRAIARRSKVLQQCLQNAIALQQLMGTKPSQELIDERLGSAGSAGRPRACFAGAAVKIPHLTAGVLQKLTLAAAVDPSAV